jgi:signal peptidase I
LVPDPQQWEAILRDTPLPRAARPSLVTDFYSYDTNISVPSDVPDLRARQEEKLAAAMRQGPAPFLRNQVELLQDELDRLQRLERELLEQRKRACMQPHWVGDLALEGYFQVTKVSPGGVVRFELVKAGIPHQCTVDLESGVATITRGQETLSRCDTPMKGPGRYYVEFANVDDRMTLVVNGRAVGQPGFAYETGDAIPVPTAADVAPAAIAVRNAAVTASDLVLKRDIYYTQDPGGIDYEYEVVWEDRGRPIAPAPFNFLTDPARFPSLARVRSREFQIGPDRFFMLGDNSPRSKDSRAWTTRDTEWSSMDREAPEVPRHLLTGKAFYVYWPHGVPFGPDIRITRDFRLIFRPYLERMRWIR